MRPCKYGAVALFADRVRAADSRFEVTTENVKPVVEICRRLDGLPLALELAAARASVLSPREICDRLDRVFDVLTEGAASDGPASRNDARGDRLELRAALLAGAVALRPPRHLWRRLYAGNGDGRLRRRKHSATRRIRVALIADRPIARDGRLRARRARVIICSRLRDNTHCEKLEKRGERQTLAASPRARAASGCRAARSRLVRGSERSWFREAEAELDNFRAALGWSLGERDDLRSGCLLAGALARVWYSLSPVEGRRWVRLAIDSITEETRADELAQLYIADAELCGALGESAASLASAEHALRLRSMLDDLQVARAQHAAGSALAATGKTSKGEALLQKALAAAERLENRRLQALALSDLGTARSRRGDVDGARRFYAEALALYVSLGLERAAASIAGQPCRSRVCGRRPGRCLASSRRGSSRPCSDPESPFGSGRFVQHRGISR